MRTGVTNYQWGSVLANALFACICLVAPAKNAEAVANLNLSTSFTSADPARGSSYMDAGGTWNGVAEVTNTTGDSLVLSVQNTAGPPAVDNSAFDIAISVDVQSGFRLPTSPYAVTVTESPACAALAGITATQPGGAGSTININIPADIDILPGCSYDFEIGLTTDDTAPSVLGGTYPVDFIFNYNEIDNDATSSQTSGVSRNVDVRRGDVALLKTAVTALAGDGDTVQFTVSILGAGQGGVFDVELTDVLSPDLTGLIINAPASPPGAPGPFPNQYTFDYIAPGQTVDVQIFATVAVDPNALVCPNLQNDADVIERLGTTSSFFDSVPFDLQTPFLEYTPPDVSIPFGVAGTSVTVPVQNTGTGVAKNISLNAANLAVYNITVNNILSPNWSYVAGVFTYTGTLAAGVSANLVFNISASSCPPPADQNIDWIPAYQNACGTDFFPPLRFSSTTTTNAPTVDVTKSVSAAALNIGNPGSYTLTLGGNNIVSLPDDGDPTNNQDFVVTDILPLGVTGAVINFVPPTTVVLVNGAPYTTGNTIPDGATITWRGDRGDLLPLPSLQIDFIAGGVCPAGVSIGNTATMDYALCSINNSDSAGFILNENPAGGAITNISIGGDGNFQAGARDTDGVVDNQSREGEHIPFTVSYSFPAGFSGAWAGTNYTSELRSAAGAGVPLVLTNNRNNVHLTITRISDGAVVCDADLNPAAGDFTGGDGTAALVITDFGSLSPAGCNALPANMADHDMVISYSATSPDGDLDGNNDPLNTDNIGGYLENTTLTVNGGPLSCLGNTDFVQAANVNIERAVLDISATFNSGNPVSVCSITPVTMNLTGPAADTNADNIFLQFNDTNFEFIDATGNPGNPATDLTYGGSLSALTINAVRSGNDIQMTAVPNTDDVTADGTVTFNVRLRDSMVPGSMAVQLAYDSNHTSPDGAATDADRDFIINNTATPFEILSGQLDMEFFPPDIILLDSTNYAFRAQITNVGTGDAVNAEYRIILPVGMTFNTSTPVPTSVGLPTASGQLIEWDLGDLAAGASVNIDIETIIDQTTCFQGPGEVIISENEWGCGTPIVNTASDPGIQLAPTQLTLTHDSNNSFCELCNEGEIRLLVTNTGSVLLTDVDVYENLLASGLTYVPNSTTYLVDGVPAAPIAEPVVSGINGEVINWSAAQIPELASLYSAFSVGAGTPQEIEIRFRVRRNSAAGFDEEGLVSANRTIQARAAFGLFCGPPPQMTTSSFFEIPIEQPVPTVTKLARNVDANQPDTAYADTVYGGTADDVIWRVQVTNNGPESRADLEDLLMNDTIGGNFDIDVICNSEANATLAATGPPPPGCISAGGGATTSTSIDVDDPFGNPDNDEVASFIDVLEGGDTFIYFVGKIENTCTNHTNDTNIAWGCEADSPPAPVGGITTPASNNGFTPLYSNADAADLSTMVNPAGVLISQTVTGRDLAPGLGAAGVVTVTIQNNSGGTVRNIKLDNVLPAGYALDQTLQTAVVTPAFAPYTGMIDEINLVNPQAADENNTSPSFTLTSSGGAAPQDNLLRHNDVLVVTLGIVKVTNFDLVADPEVRTENTGDGTDPSVPTPLNSRITVVFENTCNVAFPSVVNNLPVIPNPEDLDVDINPLNADLIYILSDPAATLTLDVQVTNNGGHDAANFFTLVTTGSGLAVTEPPGCVALGNPPPPRAVWIPALPATATVYQCTTNNPIAPGQTDSFPFSVQKALTGADLTFRADVVGEITLSDTTPLTFPPPNT